MNSSISCPTQAHHDELAMLRRAIEYAPAARPTPPDLAGYWTTLGYFVCASCASRILGRGCHFRATPSWKGEPYADCVTCSGGGR